MEVPADWQVSELTGSHQQQVWQVHQPLQPSLRDMQCEPEILPSVGEWCDRAGARWILQNFDGSYWLTRLQADAPTGKTVTRSWRGNLLQEVTNEPYQLQVYETRHHPKQLLNHLRLRHSNRNAQLVRLSAGRYYLMLHQPLEWLFLHQSSGGFLSLRLQATGAGND